MTIAKMLCDWTTVGGSGFTILRQTAEKYVDALTCKDVTVFLEVAEVTNAPLLYVETSPMRDERLFVSMLGTFLPTVGVAVNVVRYESATNPLARYVRWRVVGTGSGDFSMTFRIWLALNESGNARRIAGAQAGAPAGCGCKSGAADSCGCGGSCGAPTLATDFESHHRVFHARHAVHLDAPPPPSGASRIAAKTMMRMGSLGATVGAGAPPRPGAPPAGGGSGHGTPPPPCPTGTGINPAYTQCLVAHGSEAACAGVPEFVTFPACAYQYEANGPGALGSLLQHDVRNSMCYCEYAGNCGFAVPNLAMGTDTPLCENCPPQLYESECAAIQAETTLQAKCEKFYQRCNRICTERAAAIVNPNKRGVFIGCCTEWCDNNVANCFKEIECCSDYECQGPTRSNPGGY
jgi:hypothetical protein